ncbi:MAG: twin-arginine translocase subunit TatC [Chloroflexi bacterium]|nr:twin-arginine translocase subunit TatC [Chloroflexota bacterium]
MRWRRKPTSTPRGGESLTLMGHLDELRGRLVKCAIAVLLGTAVSFAFARNIFHVFTSRSPDIEFVYIEVTELVSIYMKVALLSGLALALPFILYQVVMFIAPALSRREKTYLYLLLPGAMVFFLGGAVFAYFILLPPALKFLIAPPFAEGIATPQIRIGSYIAVITRLLFVIGLVFDTPLVIFLLAKIGVVSYKTLMRHQRLAVVGAFVIAAIVTPTFDPVNQTLVAAPLIVLYELGIFLAWLARRKPAKVPVPAGLETQAD